MAHEFQWPRSLKSFSVQEIYCRTSFPTNRAIPPCCHIEVGTHSWWLFVANVQYVSVPEQNHELSCFEWEMFLYSIPTSENPPHWTSHVSMSRSMSDILQLRTSCDKAMFKFPPSSWNTPSGLSCGMLPSLWTNQHEASCSACWCSCLSIPGFALSLLSDPREEVVAQQLLMVNPS